MPKRFYPSFWGTYNPGLQVEDALIRHWPQQSNYSQEIFQFLFPAFSCFSLFAVGKSPNFLLWKSSTSLQRHKGQPALWPWELEDVRVELIFFCWPSFLWLSSLFTHTCLCAAGHSTHNVNAHTSIVPPVPNSTCQQRLRLFSSSSQEGNSIPQVPHFLKRI